jgi:hypothetical protein
MFEYFPWCWQLPGATRHPVTSTTRFGRSTFPPGQPGPADKKVSLESRLVPGTDFDLPALVDFLAETDYMAVEIVGYADVHECKSVGCDRLARRASVVPRAQIVGVAMSMR